MPHSLEVSIGLADKTLSGKCSCVAELSGYCHHVIREVTGWFDFSKLNYICTACGKDLETINLAVVVKAGYWLGSPNDVSYIFHQDLFVLWNASQKEDAWNIWKCFCKSFRRCVIIESKVKITTHVEKAIERQLAINWRNGQTRTRQGWRSLAVGMDLRIGWSICTGKKFTDTSITSNAKKCNLMMYDFFGRMLYANTEAVLKELVWEWGICSQLCQWCLQKHTVGLVKYFIYGA